jgi:GTP pyrophosphokinase
VPGDEIIGYITRGRGVTVHKADCPNVGAAEHERMVEVSWANTQSGSFNATINIIAYDHVSLLGELALFIGNMGVPIMAVSAKRDDKRKTSVITMVVQVTAREQLDKVILGLQRRTDIIEVYRGIS